MAVTAIYLPAGRREIAVTGVGYAPEGYFMERGYKLTPNIDKTLQKLERVPAMILSLAPTLQPLNGRWSVIRRKALLTLVGRVD